jgi:uncharacterized protein (TIGR03435 family)
MAKLGIRGTTGLLLGAVALAATMTKSAVFADAQEKAAVTRAFEVATIKRSPPLNGGAIFIRAGGLRGSQWTATGVTLLMLLRNAYGQRFPMEAQFIGAPSWAGTDRFDVVAKSESAPPADQVGPMLQTLLADRFKLQVHSETRELPVFVLVVERADRKLGPKMRPTEVDCQAIMDAQKRGDGAPAPPSSPPAPPNLDVPPPPCTMMMMMGSGSSRLRSGGLTLAQLVSNLSQATGRPVLDRTGLTGYYTVDIEYAREPGVGNGPLGRLPPEALAGPVAAPSDVPSVFVAVQEQLGLKLEARREPVEVLVIDRVEPPTED